MPTSFLGFLDVIPLWWDLDPLWTDWAQLHLISDFQFLMPLIEEINVSSWIDWEREIDISLVSSIVPVYDLWDKVCYMFIL
jgi:hypothetical protein